MAIIDANDLPAGTELRSEVCIVGGGPVGIALALDLAGRGVDSLVLEAGGTEREDAVDDLYWGEGGSLGDLSTTRVHVLGGSTNHWGGQSRPLEPVDFEAYPGRGDFGWPISRDDALGRLDDAIDFLELDHSGWLPAGWFPEATLLGDGTVVETVFRGKALRVGPHYEDQLDSSERVTVVLHANATRVRLDPDRTRVTHVDVTATDGETVTAAGDVFVVAAGGIESARLLLASTDDVPGGVGNGNDLVGRYFSDHHSTGGLPLVPGPNARLLPSDSDVLLVPELRDDDIEPLRALTLTADAQRALGLPGFHAFLLDRPAGTGEDPFDVGVEGLINVGAESPGEVRSVLVGFEQIPNPESRVTLSDERNALGQSRAAVDWRLTDVDAENMARSVELLARFLARAGVGRLATDPPAAEWLHIAYPQHHHMGTLRMGATRAEGVVDSDQRFFDVANLYAAGTAVFPAYGHVNPTLNAVAMTLRLADHLAQEVQS